MKTEIKVRPHSVLPGQNTVEIWYAGRFVGQLTGADNYPGVRVISKHGVTPLHLTIENLAGQDVAVLEVKIG